MLESDVDCSVLIVGGDESIEDPGVRSCASWRSSVASSTASPSSAPSTTTSCRFTTTPPTSASCRPTTRASASSPSRRWPAALPVVASRVGGLTGTVKDGETGYLVPWLCPEPFAERIELLLENEPLRRNLGEAAREAVARYRWENVAAGVLEVYETLTAQPRACSNGWRLDSRIDPATLIRRKKKRDDNPFNYGDGVKDLPPLGADGPLTLMAIMAHPDDIDFGSRRQRREVVRRRLDRLLRPRHQRRQRHPRPRHDGPGAGSDPRGRAARGRPRPRRQGSASSSATRTASSARPRSSAARSCGSSASTSPTSC